MVKLAEEVLIVGAGASGLAVAHELKVRGISARILDQAKSVAEPWKRRHPQLQLNTHRTLSSLPGTEFPASAGEFPDRDALIEYMERYANALDVPKEFDVLVTSIEHHRGKWVVHTSRGPYVARHLVVATGQNKYPSIPAWKGLASFKKPVLHAADFGDASDYAGKNVLVIGAGNSGTDILNHLSRVDTDQVWVSVRHGPVVVPKRFLGFPIQRMSPLFGVLSDAIADRLMALTEHLAFGDLRKWGLPKHPVGAISRLHQSGVAPAIDDGFVSGLKAGRFTVVAEVDCFSSDRVRLKSNRILSPDVVIAATGYKTGLEELFSVPGLLDEKGVPVIHGAEQLENYPGLFFSGMRGGMSGYFRAACIAGKEIATVIGAECISGQQRSADRTGGQISRFGVQKSRSTTKVEA